MNGIRCTGHRRVYMYMCCCCCWCGCTVSPILYLSIAFITFAHDDYDEIFAHSYLIWRRFHMRNLCSFHHGLVIETFLAVSFSVFTWLFSNTNPSAVFTKPMPFFSCCALLHISMPSGRNRAHCDTYSISACSWSLSSMSVCFVFSHVAEQINKTDIRESFSYRFYVLCLWNEGDFDMNLKTIALHEIIPPIVRTGAFGFRIHIWLYVFMLARFSIGFYGV